MQNEPALTPDAEALLRRYLELQAEEQRIRQEKAKLQAELADLMGECGLWEPEVDGRRLKITCRTVRSVTYDEDRLRQVLGERYRLVLEPDLRKIRKELDAVRPLLEPLLELVGTPTAEAVKAAVTAGTVRVAEFAGAFEKTVKRYVTVATPKDWVREG